MKTPIEARVLRNRPIADGMIRLDLRAPAAFSQPVGPGMFAHLAVPGASEHLLRRPISIMDADAEEGRLTLGISPKGDGTRLICSLREGQSLDLLAPLGRGFALGGAKRVWLAGGGVGAAPMLFAAKQFSKRAKIRSFLGFRTAAMAYALSEFEAAGPTILCTDDGSAGRAGSLLDALREDSVLPDLVLACGPTPMLRAVQDFCREKNIPAQLSLEQRMGCGYGACLTCACKTHDADGHEDYERVCADGPVFPAERVVL